MMPLINFVPPGLHHACHLSYVRDTRTVLPRVSDFSILFSSGMKDYIHVLTKSPESVLE